MIIKKKLKAKNNEAVQVEVFSSALELVQVSDARPINFSSHGAGGSRACVHEDLSWYGPGVKSWEDISEMLHYGYQPITEKMKSIPTSLSGEGKRPTFINDVVGFAPIVPLYLQNIPTCMVNTTKKVIKNKVLNIYYDMTANCGVEATDILSAGCDLLGAIMELELQGYRFNLSAIQTYPRRDEGADILCVRVKDANRALDIKRISFPLAHPAFFRAVGFDWYERCPGATRRSGYGTALAYQYMRDDINKMFEELFGEKCVVFSAATDIRNSREDFKRVIENAGKKVG